jgi:Mono-functional DNA-alkylating methyl methanesulfonate N-term
MVSGMSLAPWQSMQDHTFRCIQPNAHASFKRLQCWANVGDDDTRFLLGDHKGGLHLLLLTHNDDGALVGLSLRRVGLTAAAAAVTYLDSGVCFIGSRSANSQLIKLHSEPVDKAMPNNFVQVRILVISQSSAAACARARARMTALAGQ